MYICLSTYARKTENLISVQISLFCLFEETALFSNCFKAEWWKKFRTNYLKGGRVQIRHCTPIIRRNGGAHDPLHPSLDTVLGKTYILILFLSNLHMHIVMFQPYFFIKIVILFLIYMHITFPVISFVFILLYVPIYDYVPNSCTVWMTFLHNGHDLCLHFWSLLNKPVAVGCNIIRACFMFYELRF